MGSSDERASLARGSLMALVVVATCTSIFGVQLALGPLGQSAPATALAPAPSDSADEGDSSQSEPTVELPSAPRLPLPAAATQFFIAPADLDLTQFTFVYATFPGDLEGVAKDMERRLRKDGWKVRPGARSAEDSFVLAVRTPDGSAAGELDVIPLPPTPSGHTVQIVGSLELAK